MVNVFTMRSKSPASIRISAIGGRPADLRWLQEVLVPPGVDVEVVDLGDRVDVGVRYRDEEIGVIGDLITGERAIRTTGPLESALAQFALHLVDQLEAARRSGAQPEGPHRSVIDEMAAVAGATVIRPASDAPSPGAGPTSNPGP